MNPDTVVKVIDAVSRLLGTIIWPALVLFVLVRFGSAIRDFIANLGEFTLKGAGFEASGKRQKAEAAAALAAAAVSRPDEGATPESSVKNTREAVELVAQVVTPGVIRRAGRSTVLWVDDRPDNNINERHSLEALGVSFVLAASTDEAIEKIRNRSFDAIISDMSRPPDRQAGYTLLEKLRASGDRTPFIIYAGLRSAANQAEAQRRGAVSCTNRPTELFQMVLSVLRQGAEP